MSRTRTISAGAATMLLGALALTLYLEWRLLAVALIGWQAMRYLLRRLGFARARRPRASWAKNIEALAFLIAAWNTRKIGGAASAGAGRPGFTLGLGRRLRRQAAATKAIVPAPDEIPF